MSDSSAQPGVTAPMELEVMRRLNDIRRRRGLAPLTFNDRLAKAAREYSRRMAEKHFFSHTSPTGDTMVERVKAVGLEYSRLGENLFMCVRYADPVTDACQGWMRSPTHRANILQADFTETGVGIWKVGDAYYFTQLFFRPFPTRR